MDMQSSVVDLQDVGYDLSRCRQVNNEDWILPEHRQEDRVSPPRRQVHNQRRPNPNANREVSESSDDGEMKVAAVNTILSAYGDIMKEGIEVPMEQPKGSWADQVDAEDIISHVSNTQNQNAEGGAADNVYTQSQNAEGSAADNVYTQNQNVEGGAADNVYDLSPQVNSPQAASPRTVSLSSRNDNANTNLNAGSVQQSAQQNSGRSSHHNYSASSNARVSNSPFLVDSEGFRKSYTKSHLRNWRKNRKKISKGLIRFLMASEAGSETVVINEDFILECERFFRLCGLKSFSTNDGLNSIQNLWVCYKEESWEYMLVLDILPEEDYGVIFLAPMMAVLPGV